MMRYIKFVNQLISNKYPSPRFSPINLATESNHQQIFHAGTYFFFLRPRRMLICQRASCPLRPGALAAFCSCAMVAPLGMPARLLSPGLPGPLPSEKFSSMELIKCNFFKFLSVSPGRTSAVVFCLVIVPTPAASSFPLLLPLFRKSNLFFGPVPAFRIKPMGLIVCGIMMNSRIFIAHGMDIPWENPHDSPSWFVVSLFLQHASRIC